MRKILIYIGMLILLALPLAAVFAFSQGNEISLVGDKPSECTGYLYGLKFDSEDINDPTTKSAYGNTITIYNFEYKDGDETVKLNWEVTSGPGVLKVVVKTGDGDFPQTFSSFTKSGSVGRFDKEISHISFCWDDYTPATPTPTSTATSTSTSTSTPTPTVTSTEGEKEETSTPTPTETPTPTSTEEEKEDTSTPTPTSTQDQDDPETPTPTPTEEEKQDNTPTPTPTEEEKQETTTPTATEEAEEPTPVVTPDAPAGGFGPSLVPRLMPFIIIVAGLAVTVILASVYRKKTH